MVVPTYLPAVRYGGPIESVHHLSRGLAERGHDVQVFTTNVDGPDDSDVPLDRTVLLDGVEVRYFPTRFRRLYWSPQMRRALAREVSRVDLVHVHSIFLWPTLAAANAAHSAEVPFVISPRGMLVRSLVRQKSRLIKTVWIGLLEKRNFSRASAIHFTSTRELEDAEEFPVPLPRPFVVPNGIEVEQAQGIARDQPARPSRRPRVLFLGRISWKKRIDHLIRAIASVPDAELIIAGNDEENLIPSLQALILEMRVENRVRFHGWVQGGDKQRLLSEASVLVLPSLSENFGNVILEALAAGTPVITTPGVGAAEIVQTERAGLVVEGNPEAIARAIATILDDPDLARSMGENGYRAAHDNYTWAAVAGRMEEAYARILSGRHPTESNDSRPSA